MKMENILYISQHELKLLQRLCYVYNFFNYDFLLSQNQVSNKITEKYYKATRVLFYRIFCSKYGFMHIGISFDGKYIKNKHYEFTQAKIISKYLKNITAGNVLEIGCGQGANLKYLSKYFPHLKFMGVDLIPGSKLNGKMPSNVFFVKEDYHILSSIPNNSIDCMFAIETICYSTEKERLFHILYQKLKVNGTLIIFDGYSCYDRKDYSQIERLCLDVLENAYHINSFEYDRAVEDVIKKVGFSLVLNKNLDKYANPYFLNLERRIEHYCLLGPLIKFILKHLPTEISGSMVPGYILGEMVRSKLVCYKLHILKKEEPHELLYK